MSNERELIACGIEAGIKFHAYYVEQMFELMAQDERFSELGLGLEFIRQMNERKCLLESGEQLIGRIANIVATANIVEA